MKCPIDEENVSLTFLFSLFLKSQNNYYKQFLKDEKITPIQVPILLKLLNHEYIYQKDISRALSIDNALLTRNLRKLEDSDYILRIEDNDNRRQNKIKLTEKGYNLALKTRDEGIKHEEELFKNINISRQEVINIMLNLLEKSNNYNEEKYGGLNGKN